MTTPTPAPTPAPTPDPAPYVRHVSLRLQEAVTRHLRKAMTELGWLDPTVGNRTLPVPFGADPFRWQVGRLPESDPRSTIKPNLLALSFGEEPPEEEQELGAGLVMLQTALQVDVVPENEALGVAVANDLRDVLTGRLPGYRRGMDLRIYDGDPDGTIAPGYWIAFEEVSRHRNDSVDFRLDWQQVTCLVELYLPGWD